MTQSLKRSFKPCTFQQAKAILTFCITALIVCACGSTQTKDIETPAEFVLTAENIEQFINDIPSLEEPERSASIIKAAKFWLSNNDFDRAHRLLDSIESTNLPNANKVYFTLVSAELALAEGEPFIAQRFLFNSDAEQYTELANADTVLNFYEYRAQTMFNRAEYLAAFEERLNIAEMLISADEFTRQFNHDLIWESLAELPTQSLFDLSKTEANPLKQGWLSLAALSKSNGANFRQQIVDIEKWQQIWPDHPASALLPADLQLILQLADQQALDIAVILPLTGKLAAAGKALREGILAAYYDDVSLNNVTPQLRFLDSNGHDVNVLYDQAMQSGAQLVIGPLSKSNVAKLAEREFLPIPTLALNTVSETEPAASSVQQSHTEQSIESAVLRNEEQTGKTVHSTLFQFGLDVESEARQVAERAYRDGHRRALIIAPMSSWGDRGVAAFAQKWLDEGGELVSDKRYRDQRSYSSLIESAVAVDQSKRRKQDLQRILGISLEFEPRRRKDIDFIFLLAHPTQAKQLNPLLAFHYAGDISVYATSHVFRDQQNGLNDLNGVRFSSMPWLFADDLNERRAIKAYGENSEALQSLYAFGVDAYHIYPRLEQLQLIPQAQFYGSTGKLRVARENVIERTQTWAEIRRGVAVELKNDGGVNGAANGDI